MAADIFPDWWYKIGMPVCPMCVEEWLNDDENRRKFIEVDNLVDTDVVIANWVEQYRMSHDRYNTAPSTYNINMVTRYGMSGEECSIDVSPLPVYDGDMIYHSLLHDDNIDCSNVIYYPLWHRIANVAANVWGRIRVAIRVLIQGEDALY